MTLRDLEERESKLAAALADLAAQKVPADYPDWGRAKLWSAALGVVSLALAAGTALLWGSWKLGGNVLLIGLGLTLIAGAVAAFRPQS